MFRSFIYLNEDMLYTYKRQIEGTNTAQPKSFTKKKSAGLSAGLHGIGISGATETSLEGEFERDVSFDYNHFEDSLSKRDCDDYFDLVLNDYDLSTIPQMSIARINTVFDIPEEFDLVTLIGQFKPYIMESVKSDSNAGKEQDAVEAILNQASADIPFLAELDDYTLAGKLNAKYLNEEYENLEEYAEQDVYMLCKVVGTVKKERVEIFDPLKDFIRLPRAMRRSMPTDSFGLDKIIVDGPVVKVEVIAIYK